MRAPPPLTNLHRYPVTVGVSLLAVVATVAWHSGGDIAPFVMSFRAWRGEPWRLLTSALPHVDALHLLFNLYWLWVFGSAVEAAFGSLRTATIYAFFAAGSAAAEYALFRGGVGLSGVGYGLFGLLWVLSRGDDRFRDAVDARTVQLFVAWFFLCIALTAGGIWPVANVAHGMGAAQGILLGFALVARRGRRLLIACLAGLVTVAFLAGSVGRPYVNLSTHAGEELAYEGYLDLEAGRSERAAALLERAVRINGGEAGWWYNLGIAYQRLGREGEMVEAFRSAAKAEPGSAVYRNALAGCIAALAYQRQTAGDDEAAVGLYREAVDLDERNAMLWFNLGIAFQRLGRRGDATGAYEKASSLSPGNAMMQAALEASRQAAD